MSQAIKDWIEQDREQVCDDYANGEIDYEQGMRRLGRLGFDAHEARDMLNEAKA